MRLFSFFYQQSFTTFLFVLYNTSQLSSNRVSFVAYRAQLVANPTQNEFYRAKPHPYQAHPLAKYKLPQLFDKLKALAQREGSKKII